MFQTGAIFFKVCRLALTQQLLSSEDSKMDPLVSLYYDAPICATMVFILVLLVELPKLTVQDSH